MRENGNSTLIETAFRAILGSTRDMMFIKDAKLVYVAVSQPFVKMVGKEKPEDIIGKTDHQIFEDEALADRYVLDDRKLLARGQNLMDYIEPITDEGGQHRYGSTSKYILKGENGEVLGILGVTRDITKDYLVRQNYQKELKYLFELPRDVYAVSYIDIDSWRVISQRRQLISGGTIQSCKTIEELAEAAVVSIVDSGSEVAKFYQNFTQDFLRNIFESGRTHMVFKYERRLSDGRKHWVHNEIRFMMDVESGHACAMLSAKNIDKEKLEEQKLLTAAKMDKMTMVLNRDTTMEYIRQIFEKDDSSKHALFMIDVDNFKLLNDTYGHIVGDEFLIDFAAELKSSFRESDIVGRVGGDEFFALMRDVSDRDTIEMKARELLETIQGICKPYADVNLSGSIGIAVYPESGKSIEALYLRADTALYQAKREGKNKYIFFEKQQEKMS